MKFYILLLVTALITLGCDTQPKEILIASKPSQALVKLDQAELGVTPLKIKIINDTEIVVSKPGYKPYTAILSPSEDPNQIITLEQQGLSQINPLMVSPPTEAQITSVDDTGQFQANQLTEPENSFDQVNQTLVQNPQFGQPKEILIASKPSEATVRLNQVNMGITPLKVTVQKDSAIEVSKSGYQSYVNILSSADEPNLIVTLEKNQSAAKSARPRHRSSNIAKARPRLNITQLKHMYRQGKINKLDYSAEVRKLEHQMESDLIDLKMLYKRGGINKYDYGSRVREIKYRYQG